MSDNPYLLPDKVYDALKWIAVVLLPVVGWVIGELAPDFGVDPYRYVHLIDTVGAAIGMLIGASHIKAVLSKAPDTTKES